MRKNDKRFVLIVLTIVIILSCGTMLSACEEPTPLHTCLFGEWTTKVSATIENDGLQERSCTCGQSETEVIPATGVEGVRAALQGTWRSNATVCWEISFSGKNFSAAMVVGNQSFPALSSKGTYTINPIEDGVIYLNDEDGSLFELFKYTVNGNEIEITGMSTGDKYTKLGD